MRSENGRSYAETMRYLCLSLVLLVACANPNKYRLTEEEQARLAGPRPARHAEPRSEPHPDPAPKARRTTKRMQEEPEPVAAAAPEPDTPTPVNCEGSRETRVREAKDALNAWNARLKRLAPLITWADAHKCAFRDTRGTVLVTRTKEAGGVRVGVKHGHADELICDTTKWPEGFDEEAMREILILGEVEEDAVMFETIPECDAKERPSLRVRHNDKAGQKAILALP